jgi:PhnB protein
MQLIPYLNFDGDCAEAFKLYERVLGGKIVAIANYAESPMAGEVPPEWHERIMHIRLDAGEAVLMGSDAPPEYYEAPKGVSVAIHPEDVAEGERIFSALAENGKVTMPFEKTFWAERFGMLVDRFGTPWMINCAPAS